MSVGYCQRRNPTGLNYFCHFNLIFFFAVCNFVVPREGGLKTTKPLPAYLMPSFKLVLPRAPPTLPPLLLIRPRSICEPKKYFCVKSAD